jgi:TolB protein
MTQPVRLAFACCLLAIAGAAAAQNQPTPTPPTGSPGTPPGTVPDSALPAGGTSNQITVDLGDKGKPRVKLAFPMVTGKAALNETLRAAANELEETLRLDLDNTRVFDIQGQAELAVAPPTGDLTRDLEALRSLGNEIALLGEVKQEGDKLVLEARLFDLPSGQSIVGKRYRGEATLARRIAHTFADEVVLFFTSRRGIALTTIAFSSNRDGNKEIYLMDYDGRNQRRITAHKSISLSPAWSPLGDRIAYTSFFSGAPALYLVDVASGAKSPLVTDGDFNSSPAISPDGTKVAFSRSQGGNPEIYVADIDGKNLRQLTFSSGIDTNPAWSPTSREIAFTSSRAGSPQIYVMDAEGANPRRITFEGDYNDGAAWNPDGTALAYATRRNKQGFELALANLVTLESKVLTSGQGSKEAPAFSPDGRKLVFVLNMGSSSQIYVVDVDGSHLTQLTYAGQNTAADWSGYPR